MDQVVSNYKETKLGKLFVTVHTVTKSLQQFQFRYTSFLCHVTPNIGVYWGSNGYVRGRIDNGKNLDKPQLSVYSLPATKTAILTLA